eukprot:4747730-Alexandrium_andersonii.AAC.1
MLRRNRETHRKLIANSSQTHRALIVNHIPVKGLGERVEQSIQYTGDFAPVYSALTPSNYLSAVDVRVPLLQLSLRTEGAVELLSDGRPGLHAVHDALAQLLHQLVVL